jgi:hypothetical protein
MALHNDVVAPFAACIRPPHQRIEIKRLTALERIHNRRDLAVNTRKPITAG